MYEIWYEDWQSHEHFYIRSSSIFVALTVFLEKFSLRPLNLNIRRV